MCLAASVAKILKTMEVIPVFIKLLAPEGGVNVADNIQKHTQSSYAEIARHIVWCTFKKDQ